MSLVTKYAPRSFQDICGQSRAVGVLSQSILRGIPLHVLLQGAYGAGKTTLAKIYARALNCKNVDPISGSPCNKPNCSTCNNESLYLIEIDVPRYASQAGDLAPLLKAREILRTVDVRPVIFLDEVHALARDDSDQLLKVLESKQPNATYIFATTEPWRVQETIRSRLQPIEVNALSLSESLTFLNKIVINEGLKAEPEALTLVAAVAKGHPRNLLNRLDSVIDRRLPDVTVLTEHEVRSRLCIDSDTFLLKYFHALADGKPSAATLVLHEWPADWDAKSRWVQAFLLVLYYDLLKLEVFVDPMVDGVSVVDRRKLLTAFRERWNAVQDAKLSAIWLSLMSVWTSVDPMPTGSAIRLRFAEFEVRAVAPTYVEEDDGTERLPPILTKVPEYAEAFHDVDRPDIIVSDSRFLELTHVVDIADRSSFFVQDTGRGFNFAMTYWPREGTTNRASEEVDMFIDDLLVFDSQFSSVAARAIIRILERSNDGVYARIVGRLHGPGYAASFPAEFHRWMASKPDRGEIRDLSVDESHSRSLKFHWKAVAHLSGALSNEKWAGSPLKKSLGVGRSRQTGPIPKSCGLIRFYESIRGDALKEAEKFKMAFVSAVTDGAWKFIGKNWEIDEAAFRQKLKAERQQEARELPPSAYNADTPDLAKAIEHLSGTWPDMRNEPRSWPAWWLSHA